MNFNKTEIDKIFDITTIITLFTERLAPSRACNEELYNFWELVYMYEGERTIKIGDTPHRIIGNQVLFYPPNIPHQALLELNKECRIGIISFVCPSSNMSYFSHRIFNLKAREKNTLESILGRGCSMFKWFDGERERGMHTVHTTSPEQLYRLKLDIEMFLICLYTEYHDTVEISDIETAKKRNQNNEILLRVHNYMGQDLKSNLTLEQISKDCNISISTLRKTFREETGGGVIHYYNNLKIQKAMDLIKNSSLSFSQISDELGFSSPFYFSKMFKKALDVTPTEYSKSVSRYNF